MDKATNPIGTFLKNRKLCPICNLHRLAAAVGVHADKDAPPYENGAAKTPPMGWASWNLFGRNVTEQDILNTAEAMNHLHLGDLGYTYVNIDDCWMASERDENGRLQADRSTFPSGIAALVKKINALGFRCGIYSSNGTHTCEDLPASLGHEKTDAETFAEWGIEYFKYDFCHNKALPTSAPEIRGISIDLPDGTVLARSVKEATLCGTAELLTDAALSGDGVYATGLDSGCGALVFDDLPIEEAGVYTVNIRLRRWGYFEKYARLTVNGGQVFPFFVSKSRGKGNDGRTQLRIPLQKGVNSLRIENPIGSRMDSAAHQYRAMGQALKEAAEARAKKTGEPVRPICFSICEWGLLAPWRWGKTAGNLWRTTADIKPDWKSILRNYEINVLLAKYADAGHFNDPDMLEVGNGQLTAAENRAHFSLWCMMAAPLILGNDVTKLIKPDGAPDLANPVLKTVTNKNAIAIDQDPLCIQCRRIKAGRVDVLVKPLKNRELAVCLFNKGAKRADGSFDIGKLCELPDVELPKAERYTVYDVWENTTFVTRGEIKENVDGHDVRLYRIKATA
ncbi:MAG: alpha-galactosidase [Clostridia bacterium]|nr:alpha-galactosidase [Clostridia bacterium]MBR0536696.1 alpha-galactosidase [Clostridia bacterium]